jgi:hypothetical protein
VLGGVKIPGFALVALLTACVTPSTADAQVNSRFAAGLDVSIAVTDHTTAQDYTHGGVLLEPLWRFGTTDPGWGFHWGLNWYEASVDRSIGNVVTDLGEVRIRPIMAGYGYTWVRGRNTVSANVLGGFAFASMKMAPAAGDAYRTRLGVKAIDTDVSNPFVVKPEIDVWHDINKYLGLNVNIGYMLARPDVAVTTTTGVDRRTVRADQFLIKVGLVYSFF